MNLVKYLKFVAFQEGRGYPIERENYLNDLRTQKIDA